MSEKSTTMQQTPAVVSEQGCSSATDCSSPDGAKSTRGHRRSNSFLMVKHMRETPDEVVDQLVSPNANAEWVNMKGA
mgnify:FL=1